MSFKSLESHEEEWLGYSTDVDNENIFEIFGNLEEHIQNKFDTECSYLSHSSLINKCDNSNKHKIFSIYFSSMEFKEIMGEMWFFNYLSFWCPLDTKKRDIYYEDLFYKTYGIMSKRVLKYFNTNGLIIEYENEIKFYYSLCKKMRKKVFDDYLKWRKSQK